MIWKEWRALAPAWLAGVMVIAGLATLRGGDFRALAIGAYFIGTAALAALSVGHEYSYRTLSMLLAQPVSRPRLLATKLFVLVPMLLSLLALTTVLPVFDGPGESVLRWIAPTAALCLAPWLTMITRNPIAGTIFSVSIPGSVWVVSGVIAMAVYGDASDTATARVALYWIVSTLLCAAGALLGVRKFLHLEAIDARDEPVQLPQWFRSSRPHAAVSASRWWLLIEKELHLQQMAFLTAGLYVCAFGLAWALETVGSQDALDAFSALSIFYALMMSVLIGALSSAEERHLGTIDWQLMLPLASSVQWAIKVGVSLVLTLLLAIGLPSLLAGGVHLAQPSFIGPVLFVTSCAIYVSSRSSSGIQALLVSFAAAPVVAFLFSQFVAPSLLRITEFVPLSVIALAAAAVALWRGLVHHRVSRPAVAR